VNIEPLGPYTIVRIAWFILQMAATMTLLGWAIAVDRYREHDEARSLPLRSGIPDDGKAATSGSKPEKL
jgi:hypothetical protein